MTNQTWTAADLAGTKPIRAWRPPARRDYNPKPADPGQRITWTRHEPGHWTKLPDTWGGRMPDDSDYVQPRNIERTGTIWSDGPRARTVWVQPDDAGHGDMVLVEYRTAHDVEARRYYNDDAPVSECRNERDRDWQRATIRRCDHLNASAGLFRELKAEQRWGDYKPHDYVVAYHCDPACPAIKYRTEPTGNYAPPIGDTIRKMLAGQSDSNLCATCVWLNPDQPAEAAA